LLEFIASTPAPIYVGFGSMMDRDSETVLEIIIKALELCNQRAVIAIEGITKYRDDTSRPEQYYITDALPHDWIFPRMKAAVHHGGAGTTAASILAGIPSVIVPHNYDQPFWGKRVSRLGIGPQPIPRKLLTAQNLAAAIGKAVSDPAIIHKAADFGTKLRSENGVARAVELFHHYIS
jgi:UDP:flavonoid glycosyltransferase YjiC (YdhE family)